MAQDLIIQGLQARDSNKSVTNRAMTAPNGDVEIVQTRGDTDHLLAVIPREKRAELANFLVTAQ